MINYNHLFPTRYALELEGLKGVVSNDTFKEVEQRKEAKKAIKKLFEERYQSGKNRWFFTPLRVRIRAPCTAQCADHASSKLYATIAAMCHGSPFVCRGASCIARPARLASRQAPKEKHAID